MVISIFSNNFRFLTIIKGWDLIPSPMGLGQFILAQQIPAFENAKIKRDINQ